MPFWFNTLLDEAGIDPADARLLRHQPKVGNRAMIDVWRTERSAFEGYQSFQPISKRAHFSRAYWASFIGTWDGRTVFAGLYEVGQPAAICDRMLVPPVAYVAPQRSLLIRQKIQYIRSSAPIRFDPGGDGASDQLNGRSRHEGRGLRCALRPSAVPRVWLAAIALLVMALAWQNFLLQTHWHAPASQAIEASTGSHSPDSGRQLPKDQQPVCLVCMGAAHATPALPSVPPSIAAPLPILFVIAAIVLASLFAPGIARPWQSRAPPVSLQV